jgi:hypothetical protein
MNNRVSRHVSSKNDQPPRYISNQPIQEERLALGKQHIKFKRNRRTRKKEKKRARKKKKGKQNLQSWIDQNGIPITILALRSTAHQSSTFKKHRRPHTKAAPLRKNATITTLLPG